ncbi:MAG: response regulator [Nitrospiraceae bacterium]
MPQANILIVEDEPIVAKDIQVSLQRLGYRVPATATSGEEAIRKAGESRPDLILMDIVLKGNMDGVETVKQIRKQCDVPVIYLTAYADDHTLERAKVTSPAGYMLKPYQPTELRTTIELALHRAGQDRHGNEGLQWLAATVRCLGDGVMTIDRNGRVTYLNPAAEDFTGWTHEQAAGISVVTMVGLEPGAAGDCAENPSLKAMTDMRVIGLEDMVLLTKSGARRLINGSAAPVVNERGAVIGSVLVFHAATPSSSCPHDRKVSRAVLLEMERNLGRPQGMINLCAWCKRVPDASGEWYDLSEFIAERSPIQFNGGLCPDCMARCFPQTREAR